MTVKMLSLGEKDLIAVQFLTRKMNVTELAAKYGCSRRTIIRVLQELGINPTSFKSKVEIPEPLSRVPEDVLPLTFMQKVKRFFSNLGVTWRIPGSVHIAEQ